MSIILGKHFEDFIKRQVESGQYKFASEIIRTRLRMLEDENHKIEAIKKALVIGEESGKPKLFNQEKFKVKMKKRLGK